MIELLELKIKNFLSVGNKIQTIKLSNTNLTLIIGENLDVKGNLLRNGVGKSTIIQALSYVLYGVPLTSIKKDNLINKINKKEMFVSVVFKKNNNIYKIERGRKPNFLKWYVNNNIVNQNDTNETESENKWTQKEIERVLNISHLLFKYLIVMNTTTEPFLSLPVSLQRQFIEELFRIKILSQKAEDLKLKIKKVEQKIIEKEAEIKTLKENNLKIEKTIKELENKSLLWNNKKERELSSLKEELKKLSSINIEEEIKNQEYLKIKELVKKEYENVFISFKNINSLFENKLKELKNTETELFSLKNKICPMCKRSFYGDNDHNHVALVKEIEKKFQKIIEEKEILEKEKKIVEKKFNEEKEKYDLIKDYEIKVYYDSLNEALEHKNLINHLNNEIEKIERSVNIFEEQIKTLKENSIQHFSYEELNKLNYELERQKVLLKLLVNKDSFIRKKIIDQNLDLINLKLNYYSDILNTNYTIKFQNDLTVEIKQFDVDYDFENLSRGEKIRVILALNFSFRDLLEITNTSMNLLFIDELIDNGLDNYGIESTLELLKIFANNRKKDIFLISHREELMNRVNNIMYVTKLNNFTEIKQDFKQKNST